MRVEVPDALIMALRILAPVVCFSFQPDESPPGPNEPLFPAGGIWPMACKGGFTGLPELKSQESNK